PQLGAVFSNPEYSWRWYSRYKGGVRTVAAEIGYSFIGALHLLKRCGCLEGRAESPGQRKELRPRTCEAKCADGFHHPRRCCGCTGSKKQKGPTRCLDLRYAGGQPKGGQSPSGLQLTMVQTAVWKPPAIWSYSSSFTRRAFDRAKTRLTSGCLYILLLSYR